ncbi:SigB/SigF/SigG family RNA polymerase sigma factor [Rhizomonospora bruguierae]|uniref:SigB/SigF/SigG family RNA polymerase sigma factor n=1 Tax=Rhizomonospora bruguierae TaxID=1581705 RepID=UPI001BCBBEC9|nr:SigB/SigF/SigG family RNA polymerase sigma factor [Micromonospora sp. NBRC 107566]
MWRTGHTDVVRVSGTLDHAASRRLRLVVSSRLDAGRGQVIVDVSRLRVLDTASVDVLLGAAGEAERRGRTMRLVGASGPVLDVLAATGAAARLGVYDEPRAAGAAEEAPAPRAGHSLFGPELNRMLLDLSRLPSSDPRRRALQQEVVERALPHARRLAHRFVGLGEPIEDLEQVAALGLIKAVRGYDPQIGTDFSAYAAPTIIGELKRHFRDKGWAVRVPRRAQDVQLQIGRAHAHLAQRLARTPTVADLAAHLQVAEDEITATLAVASAYRPLSLFAPSGGEGEVALVDRLGEPDPDLELADIRESIEPLLHHLRPRDRKIVILRFFGNMTQQQIGTELGISQMHVSRLLRGALQELRRRLPVGDSRSASA